VAQTFIVKRSNKPRIVEALQARGIAVDDRPLGDATVLDCRRGRARVHLRFSAPSEWEEGAPQMRDYAIVVLVQLPGLMHRSERRLLREDAIEVVSDFAATASELLSTADTDD